MRRFVYLDPLSLDGVSGGIADRRHSLNLEERTGVEITARNPYGSKSRSQVAHSVRVSLKLTRQALQKLQERWNCVLALLDSGKRSRSYADQRVAERDLEGPRKLLMFQIEGFFETNLIANKLSPLALDNLDELKCNNALSRDLQRMSGSGGGRLSTESDSIVGAPPHLRNASKIARSLPALAFSFGFIVNWSLDKTLNTTSYD